MPAQYPGIGCPPDGPVSLLRKITNNLALIAAGGGGGGVTSILAGAGISVDQPTGNVTITAAASAPTDYETATNNSGNTTITPTVAVYALGLTVGGAARTSILILATARRAAGDRLRVDLTLPAPAATPLEVRHATSGGTLLLPAEIFPSQQFTTDGVVLSAAWDFVYTGSAWRYELSNIPA